MVGVGTSGDVPLAFVDADHAAGVAGDAAVGEEVGRVGEDEVDGIFRNGGKDFQAIALVDAEVVFGVVEGERWKSGGGFGHDDDRSGSLITTVMVSSRAEERKVEIGNLKMDAGREKHGGDGAGWKPAFPGG